MVYQKHLTISAKKIILYLHNEGKTYSYIAELFNKRISTISSAVQKMKSRNSIENLNHPGRSKKLTKRERLFILQENKKNSHLSAPQLNIRLRTSFNVQVSNETVRRVLKSDGINGRVTLKKPLLPKANIKKRFLFAKTYKTCYPDFWNTIIWSDKSKFDIFGSDRRRCV